MTVGTCKYCNETIIQRLEETYYVHTRTAMSQCGIRYATPVNPTADEAKDPDEWTRTDLDAFWEGLNGLTRQDCVHTEAGLVPDESGELIVTVFVHCPKCGWRL